MKTHEIYKALELRGFPGGLSQDEMKRLVDAVRSCVDKALSEVAHPQASEPAPSTELPGMWDTSDFLDGATDQPAPSTAVERATFSQENYDVTFPSSAGRKRLQPTALPAPESDLSGLKPNTQERIREWLTDGTFVSRAIGVMREQEATIVRLASIPAQDVNAELVEAAENAVGCFVAAEFEGLNAALLETPDERLKDLVVRRLIYASEPLATALANAKAVQEKKEV